ncbi:MAG: fibronectin type III domain-containing protein [Candidatus Omnitrophota bacterium]
MTFTIIAEQDELREKESKESLRGKNKIRKKVLSQSRKILSTAVAALFLGQVTLADYVRAEVPPPTADELINPQTPTVALDEPLQETVSETSAQTEPAPTEDFFMAGPLSAPTAALTTQGRSFYLSATGSDQGDGSEADPYGSISYAVSQLQAGDTLYIMEGTYQQPGSGAVFSTSGTADAPITIQGLGNVVIEGTTTTTISGYTVAANYNPAFNTNGQDYIHFNNLTVNNLRAAVTVGPNSSYIEIDGLRADRNHFAVLINGGDHVTVRNAVVTNSRNGFRTEATTGVTPTDILYENIDVSGSKDVYSGFETRYRNGDGFILEFGNRITVRNVKSYDNWDGGFDVKATNVLMENVEVYGNKNNFKVWGSGIVVKDSLSHDAKVFVGDPVAGEGYGVNNRMGQITFINTTFANNETADIRIDNDGGASSTTLQNSIIVRNLASGALYVRDGGSMTESNNIWYDPNHPAGFTLSSTSQFVDPRLVDLSGRDFHLQSGSPAIDAGSMVYPLGTSDLDGHERVAGSSVDIGAYEFGSTGGVQPEFTGVQNGATVSGTVQIGPNLQIHTDLNRVVYLLNGVSSGDVDQSPFYWGGISGNGTSGLDTRTLENGDYTLNALCYGAAETHEMSVSFSVMNLPPDTEAPLISAVAVSNVTSNGATITWATHEPSDSQVEYRVQGDSDWLATSLQPSWVTNHSINLNGLIASTVYQFRVKSRDAAGNLATQATIATFTTANPAPTGDYVGVTEGATVSGVVNIGPNLYVHPDIRKAAYYLNGTQSGKVYASPYLWGGPSGDGTTGFDTRTLSDGNYTLAMGYTDSTGDHSMSVSFVVSNTASDTAAPVISAVTSADVTETGATIQWATDEASDSLVEYRVQGAADWSATVVDPALVTSHSMTLNGLVPGTVYEFRVKSKDAAGNQATQAAISTLTTLTPADTAAPVISAVTSADVTETGATIQWATDEASDSLVEYRVQGAADWSATVVDPALVTSHSMTLSGLVPGTVYEFRVKSKDAAGNQATQAAISTLTTADTTVPSTGDFVGVAEGAIVSGMVNIGPNLTLHPGIRKVAYYLNGTKSGKVYQAPFLWGGPSGDGTTGFDTRTLADGNYTLAMGYTDATGDHGVQISFTVKNAVVPAPDTTVPVISAVTSANVTETGATIQWTTDEASDSLVEYRVQGTANWSVTSVDPALVTNHSMTLSGLAPSTVYEFRVKSKDAAGNQAAQAAISTLTTASPPAASCTTAICGVTEGQTVSGTVMIQPNLTLNPGIRKVAYYLNGTKSGKVYTPPFTWGGPNGDGTSGFDTRTLTNGTYTLSMVYTDDTGDHAIPVVFTVSN